MPIQMIKDFAAKCDKIYVVEQLDPVIENHCKTIGVDVIGKMMHINIPRSAICRGSKLSVRAAVTTIYRVV